MESSRPLWRVIRPVLLAAAAATSWLAISASAATADSATDREPLTGQALSTVTSVLAPDAQAPKLSLAPRPDEQTFATGLSSALPPLQPLTNAVANRADALVASVPVAEVPVVGSVVTLPPLTPVTDPVAGLADDVVSAVAGTVGSGLATVVDGVGPVLDAVTGPVSGVVTPPAVPASPLMPPTGAAEAQAEIPAEASSIDSATSATDVTATPAAAPDHRDAVTAASSSADLRTLPDTLHPAADGTAVLLSDAPSDDLDPAGPNAPQGIPGSGSGTGAPSGGNAHPAWLLTVRLHLAGSLSIPALGDLLAPPSPVSLDPGSSPD